MNGLNSQHQEEFTSIGKERKATSSEIGKSRKFGQMTFFAVF